MLMFHSGQGLGKHGINQCLGLFSSYEHESEEAEGLAALAPLPLEPALPCSLRPSPEPALCAEPETNAAQPMPERHV